jgi:hypothetical protein
VFRNHLTNNNPTKEIGVDDIIHQLFLFVSFHVTDNGEAVPALIKSSPK